MTYVCLLDNFKEVHAMSLKDNHNILKSLLPLCLISIFS